MGCQRRWSRVPALGKSKQMGDSFRVQIHWVSDQVKKCTDVEDRWKL